MQPAPIKSGEPYGFLMGPAVWEWFMDIPLLLQLDGLLKIQIGDGGYYGPPVI